MSRCLSLPTTNQLSVVAVLLASGCGTAGPADSHEVDNDDLAAGSAKRSARGRPKELGPLDLPITGGPLSFRRMEDKGWTRRSRAWSA